MHLPHTRFLFQGACLGLAILVVGAVGSMAQYDTAGGAADIKDWKPAEFQGKIESVKGGTLTALNFGNERIFIYVNPQYIKTLSVKGTAEPSALKAGMGIRFSGKVDEKGVLADKVSDLYLVTHEGGHLAECALNEDADISGTIVSVDTKGNVKATINGVKKDTKGEKEVVVKRVKLATFQLGEGVKITVDVKDVGLARMNDTLTVTGKQVKEEDVDHPNQIIAETLSVDMAEPLSNKRRSSSAGADKKKGDAFQEGARQAEGEKMEAPKKEAPAKKEPPAKKELPKKDALKKAAAAK